MWQNTCASALLPSAIITELGVFKELLRQTLSTCGIVKTSMLILYDTWSLIQREYVW
jgi:3-mercaptopyruvate sulfurtransferase SseA